MVQGVLFYCVSEHCSCRVMFQCMQSLHAIMHPCCVTRYNVKLNDNTPFYSCVSDFGGLEVACWPLVPKFAGSHPAEAVGF